MSAQGVFIGGKRPASKAEVKKALKANPAKVQIEATDLFGFVEQYDGPASEMPEGHTVYFQGPDPYRMEGFFGQIEKRNGRFICR